MMEQGAVPAGLGITHPKRPGGAGAPPAGTRTCREELADGEGSCFAKARKSPMLRKGSRSEGSRKGRKPPKARPGLAVRHRDGAPRGAASFAKGRARSAERELMWRLAALHPLGMRRGQGREGRRTPRR